MVGLSILHLALVAIIPLALLIGWGWALVDILKSKFDGSDKVIWLLVVLLIPFLGSILYLMIGRKQKISGS